MSTCIVLKPSLAGIMPSLSLFQPQLTLLASDNIIWLGVKFFLQGCIIAGVTLKIAVAKRHGHPPHQYQ
jgi:hypothetical protein